MWSVYIPKIRKIFSFGGYAPTMHEFWQNLAWKSGPVHSSTTNFAKIMATSCPCGAKKTDFVTLSNCNTMGGNKKSILAIRYATRQMRPQNDVTHEYSCLVSTHHYPNNPVHQR